MEERSTSCLSRDRRCVGGAGLFASRLPSPMMPFTARSIQLWGSASCGCWCGVKVGISIGCAGFLSRWKAGFAKSLPGYSRSWRPFPRKTRFRRRPPCAVICRIPPGLLKHRAECTRGVSRSEDRQARPVLSSRPCREDAGRHLFLGRVIRPEKPHAGADWGTLTLLVAGMKEQRLRALRVPRAPAQTALPNREGVHRRTVSSRSRKPLISHRCCEGHARENAPG